MRLPGVTVTDLDFEPDRVVVDVRLRRRRLVCPECGWPTAARHNWQPRPSTWRALDLGPWKVVVRARLRRLDCRPCRRVLVEAVPFARHRAEFVADFEDLVAWLVKHTDKSAVTRLCRINWRTVGAICERVVADQLDDTRLDELYAIGVDEVPGRVLMLRPRRRRCRISTSRDSGTCGEGRMVEGGHNLSAFAPLRPYERLRNRRVATYT